MRRTLTVTGLLGLLALSGAAMAQDARPAGDAARDQSARPAASAEPHIAAGLAAYWKLRFPEAERHFRAATEADSRSAAAHFYLGYTIYKIAEPKRPNDPGKQRAADEFAKAYAIDPGFTPAWGRHGS